MSPAHYLLSPPVRQALSSLHCGTTTETESSELIEVNQYVQGKDKACSSIAQPLLYAHSHNSKHMVSSGRGRTHQEATGIHFSQLVHQQPICRLSHPHGSGGTGRTEESLVSSWENRQFCPCPLRQLTLCQVWLIRVLGSHT